MDYHIKSVERAFEIMKAISIEPLTPAELSIKLQINKSTIHRFLSTLINLGYVEKLSNHSIRLTQSFINLGINAQKQYEVFNTARPYLVKLAEEFKESALLSVFNGTEVQYVDKVESPHAVRTVFDPGKKAPAYAVASGKMFLSSLGENELEYYLDNQVMTAFTDNTLTDRDKLKKEIAKIKEKEYALDNEEYEIGLRGFACPIKDYRGDVIAALCIAGIAPRLTDKQRISKIVQALLYASKEVSLQLGFQNDLCKSSYVKNLKV
ncbi:IclR family transcriptional regulator [Pseudalkalibacillus sp. A8]|uniref:IclR family transcriptional regulator n=1 Tax=Pseudalkalibacillus sp. A8 TaxID=3382641 RepID=UPI0038B645FD